MIRIWWIFYKKIFLLSLSLTGISGLLVISLTGKIPLFFYGFIYTLFSPFVHLFLYDFSNPQEYYFYANLGLMKLRLWLITGGIALALTPLIYFLK